MKLLLLSGQIFTVESSITQTDGRLYFREAKLGETSVSMSEVFGITTEEIQKRWREALKPEASELQNPEPTNSPLGKGEYDPRD